MSLTIMFALTGLIGVAPAHAQSTANRRLIVHEWGVITQIASPEGSPLAWRPLETLPAEPEFVGQYPVTDEPMLAMLQVPAVFFRVNEPMDISLAVVSLDGWFASCYPKGQMLSDHRMAWPQVTLMPKSPVALLRTASTSQYYTARNTAASYVRVDDHGHKQYERFLSLRALGQYKLPLSVTVNQEQYTLTQADVQADSQIDASPVSPVPFALLIENVDGQLGYEVVALKDTGSTVTRRPKRDANADLAQARLRKVLSHEGLFPDEAAAAVGGVRQAWFGPGVRVIYFLPDKKAQQIMTMHISPKPSEHRRVYAVCVELITPKMRQDFLETLASVNPKDTDACNLLMRSSPLVRPMLTQLLAKLPQDDAQANVHDDQTPLTTRQKITQLLSTSLASR